MQEVFKWGYISYGILFLLTAFIVDILTRKSKDFAFWIYLFGLISFWSSLTLIDSASFTGKIIYLAINFFLVFVGAILGRRVFAVFGGIGITIELSMMSFDLFPNPFIFVILLTVLGFTLILAGIFWSKYERRITIHIRMKLPTSLRELLESRKD